MVPGSWASSAGATSSAAANRMRLGYQRLRDSRGELIEGDDFVERGIAHDSGNQSGMHSMTGTLRDDIAEQRAAEQRQIADQVQRLVAAALIWRAEAFGI